MDEGTSVVSSKRQKMFEGQLSVKNEDRISHLPDDILHHILSFLPTKFAVGTSVLSSKWKYQWTSVRILDFCDSLLYTRSKKTDYTKRKRLFNNFVDQVVLFNKVTDIQKFSLKCGECDAARFNEWISTLRRRKVEELVISITKIVPCMLSPWLLTCELLRVLKIKMEGHVTIPIPSSVHFTSLKVLHLTQVVFSSDQEVQEVSLCFPILEELVIIFCTWPKVKTVNISVPTLQTLRIKDFVCNDFQECEVKIDAESLTSLKFKSNLRYKYSLRHLSSLVDAYINISPHAETSRAVLLLREISNVRNLVLPCESVQILTVPAVSASMCHLSRLTHLHIANKCPCNGRLLINLLCSTPNLESLSFPNGTGLYLFRGNGRIHGTTPHCFLSRLKLVNNCLFRGTAHELWFVKFLMKSVRVMDKLTIKLMTYRKASAPGWQEAITKQLRISEKYPNCVLEFK